MLLVVDFLDLRPAPVLALLRVVEEEGGRVPRGAVVGLEEALDLLII